MKKIFTLLFAAGMFTLAQAQPGANDNRQFDQRNSQRNDQQTDQRNNQQNDQMEFDKGYDKGKFLVETNDYFDRSGRYNDRFSMERKRDMLIARINQEYDYKIQRVRRDFFLSWFEKQRQIRFLDHERQWEISMVYDKCNNYRGRYDDRNNRFERYDRNERSQGHY